MIRNDARSDGPIDRILYTIAFLTVSVAAGDRRHTTHNKHTVTGHASGSLRKDDGLRIAHGLSSCCVRPLRTSTPCATQVTYHERHNRRQLNTGYAILVGGEQGAAIVVYSVGPVNIKIVTNFVECKMRGAQTDVSNHNVNHHASALCWRALF